MKRKIKRFGDGGSTGDYTGDDPIVKYRMGQLSEADTYEAMGQKDLANASRAKELTKIKPVSVPVAEETDNSNSYANLKKLIPEAPADFKLSAPTQSVYRKIVGLRDPEIVAPEVDSEAYREKTLKEKAAQLRDTKISDQKVEAARKKNLKKTKPYKLGGTVKRSSASSRGDGIATKGHTRGKFC